MSWTSELTEGFNRWLDHIFQRERGTATNMTQLAIDVERARGVLTKLQGKVEEVRGQQKRLEALYAETETCWRGRSGDALREHLTRAVNEQKLIGDEMEANVSQLQKLVDRIVEEDQLLADKIRTSPSLVSGGGRHG